MRANLIPPLLGYYTMASGAAAPVPWYLAGGISSGDCIAAYQPKGAVSLAASYVNLANPGTYDCYVEDDCVAPDFDQTTGWTFADGKKGALINGLSTSGYLSVVVGIASFGASSVRVVTNNVDYDGNLHFYPRYTDGNCYIRGYSTTGISAAYSGTSGVYAVVPGNGYRNGTSLGTYAYSPQTTTQFRIAHENKTYFWFGILTAIAIYSGALTSTQVGAITDAINAL